MAKREKTSGIIISALGDAPLRVVMDAEDDPARMLQLLDSRYASNRTVSRISVQTQLFQMLYTDQNISTYIDQYTSLFSQLECMGKDAAIPESHKASMLLVSIDPNCALESTAADLPTKDSNKLTWDYVTTTLIDEYNAKVSSGTLSKRKKKRNKSREARSDSTTADVVIQDETEHDSDSDTDTTVRAFAAVLRSLKTDSGDHTKRYHCEFCGRSGHTEDRCYMNRDNPNNQIPSKLRKVLQNSETTAVMSHSTRPKKPVNVEFAGASVESTTISPPKDLRSYAESGATCHCFHSKSAFVPNSLGPCVPRTVLLPNKMSVTATQMGEVLLPFENANIRLGKVLYIPNLGNNLVSTGKLTDNGIESHFRRFDVRLILESTSFFVGNGNRDSGCGMYVFFFFFFS